MFVLGLTLGIISRYADIYTQNLGNMFSQMAIWILMGTVISIYSSTQKKAMIHVFFFCIGMLITYYLVAIITEGVYSETIMMGWTVFAVFCPVFSYFTWMTKEKGLFPKIISMGIVVVSLGSTILLFDHLRIYDFIINAY